MVSMWARRLFIGLVVLSSILTLFFAIAPQGRAALHTGFFVLQVLEVPFKPQPWFTGDPLREEVFYPQPGGTGVADIYRVEDGDPKAAVLLFLGANAAGRDDEDVVNLGNALARAGFVAMFHWSPTMALQHNIDLAERENLVWAFQYLAAQEFVDPERVGLGGFCVGASFSLVAAADPRIRDEVKFVNAFGPYFDAGELLLQVASRSKLDKGQRVPWDPDHLTLKVFANELIETLRDNDDIEVLTRVHLNGGQPTLRELEQLSAEGQVVNQLLLGATPEEAEALYSRLPAGFRQEMRAISPNNYVDDISARLMILHDRDDRLVPAAESRRLAAAFEDRGGIRYTEVLDFDHVRPASGGGAWQFIKEGAKLYRHMYSVMRDAT